MLFSVVPDRPPVASTHAEKAFLIRDPLDDWREFETTFQLTVFDVSGARYDVGAVKIGQLGMDGQRSPALPQEFDALDERFFSLGQDENYYDTLNQLPSALGNRIRKGLRDVADDLSLYERARQERVMSRSLLRFVTEETVRGRFHRLARGDTRLTHFKFAYEFPKRDSADTSPLSLSFEVTPGSRPPTNIHVLIGRNGVGKTRCLNLMARSVVEQGPNAAEVGVFASQEDDQSTGLFANLVFVTFSAFDRFGPLPEPHAVRYEHIGLKRPPSSKEDVQSFAPKTLQELTDEFVTSVSKCRSGARALRWHHALETLEADPLFKAEDAAGLSGRDSAPDMAAFADEEDDAGWEQRARRLYERLGSGHKVALLTITRLVETVDERTLVLIDEPEAYLHPPLLSAFVRSLSDLLMQRNGVALIATHSPVVLQEAPRTCVWVLHRSGDEARADRPGIETFGENVGILTREAFGLEVTQSGFHKLLEEAVEETGRYEAVLERFGGQLGTEARVIARGLVADRAAAPSEDSA